MKLSVIVPCYNEEKNIFPLFEAVEKAFALLPAAVDTYELVLVNDGSKDQTAQKLRELYAAHSDKVSVVQLSRNFGKEAALFAGFQHVSGDFTAVMDADLQQRPETVVEMVVFLLENEQYDAVAAYQQERIEGKGMSLMKKWCYRWMNKMCDTRFYPGASDFRVLRRKVVDAILSVPEYFRFSKGIFSWVGFETYYMPYTPDARLTGDSKWSFFKLFRYAVEGFIAFTTKPLKISTFLGIFSALASLVYMLVVIIQKLFFSVDVPGYATIVVLTLFLGGAQLFILGIMGEYLARTYMQGKNRPIYIEKEYLKAKKEQNDQ